MMNKNVSFFKNIGVKVFGYFAKNNTDSIEKDKIRFELQTDFESYLQVGDAIFCLEMMETGYQPEKNQKTSLRNLVFEKVFSKELSYEDLAKFTHILQNENLITFPFLFDYVRKNNQLDKDYVSIVKKETIDNVVENFMQFMTSFQKYYEKGLDILNRFNNYQPHELKEKFEKFDTYTQLFKELYTHGVMDGESFISFSRHLENTIKQIKSVTNAERSLNNSYENIKLDHLEKTRLEMRGYAVSNTNLNAKSDILNKIKKISNDSIEKNIKNLVIQRSYSISQLDNENKEQIKNIELLTEKINQKEVNEFVETRLPIILEKYLSIDKEYRTNLKNVEGFNAKELMNQSLENIIVLLTEKLENKNTDLIKDLSVENRKLRTKSI